MHKSNTSETKPPSEATKSERGSESETDFRGIYSLSMSKLKQHPDFKDYHFKPAPFSLRWVHGFNSKVGVINLNDLGSTEVFYAASNCGVIWNWTLNTMKILQGHRHMVTCIAADQTGRWLVTGDTGPENVIIIWDSRDCFPQKTIFNPHQNIRLAKLTLSADAKYLLTIGYSEKVALHWWIWSCGWDAPHATIDIEMPRDSVIAMEFNPYNTTQFVLLTKQDMWIGYSSKIFVNERGVMKETDDYQLQVRCPDKKVHAEYGRFTCFTFTKDTSQILVATSRGGVVVFGYTIQYETGVDPHYTAKIENLKFVKVFRIEKSKINVIKHVDGMVITGNTAGEIHFYDDQIKLLYWIHGFIVDNVKGLSFNISPRSCMVLDPACNKMCPCWEQVVAEVDPESGLMRQKLVKKLIPTDATRAKKTFLIRDFIVLTHNEGIAFVDFVTEKLVTILNYRISPALSLTVHPEKQFICVGYADGNIELINFDKHKIFVRLDLRDFYKITIPPNDDSIKGDYVVTHPQLSVSCLKYSSSVCHGDLVHCISSEGLLRHTPQPGTHLACGLNTGQLLFLDPTTIDIITNTPFKDTSHSIKEINFSPDSLTLAFSDTGKTVCVYKYDCETLKWNFVGKHRAHYKDISAVYFLPEKNPNGDYKLISLGHDRVMVEYDIGQSSDEYLEILSIDRMDQSAVPLCGIVWPTPKQVLDNPEELNTDLPMILVANDEFKYKILNYNTTMTLATYLGPRYDHPVNKMLLTSRTEVDDQGQEQRMEYLLFATKHVIGLQRLPLDGNPWKHTGMLGHPNMILQICYRHDLKTLFNIGHKDSCMCQWSANHCAPDYTTQKGGGDLDPYYCLVENGRPGWLFQEVRDLFYYIQILCQGTFSPAMRRVKDYIPIDSLPDLMRALGFFPSEYEVENMLVEAKHKIYQRNMSVEIDFEEFVRLYLNHRPALGENYFKVKKAFKNFAHYAKDDYFIQKDEFIDVLENYGECFSRELSWYLLSILSGQSFEDRAVMLEDDFSFLPEKIRFTELATTIMGIPDMELSSQASYAGSTYSEAPSSQDSEEKDREKEKDQRDKDRSRTLNFYG